jgi:hypothetical protein
MDKFFSKNLPKNKKKTFRCTKNTLTVKDKGHSAMGTSQINKLFVMKENSLSKEKSQAYLDFGQVCKMYILSKE